MKLLLIVTKEPSLCHPMKLLLIVTKEPSLYHPMKLLLIVTKRTVPFVRSNAASNHKAD